MKEKFQTVAALLSLITLVLKSVINNVRNADFENLSFRLLVKFYLN